MRWQFWKRPPAVKQGRPDAVKFVARGFHDVFWCPFINEPNIIQYSAEDKPICTLCGCYESETHEFICHIGKPK